MLCTSDLFLNTPFNENFFLFSSCVVFSPYCICAIAGVDCSVSSNGFTSAAAEWWMLGYAHYHVITLYSGFGRSGAYRTLEAERMYTIHQTVKECNATSFTKHEDMQYEWAGI